MRNEIVTITPFMASEWLKHNSDKNRKLRTFDVEKYARDMVCGNWYLTHQGIAFDEDGQLVDGQHRLSAIVLSGVPVDMYVATGVKDSAIKVIDSGLNRTMPDKMKTAGRDSVFRSTKSAAFVRTVNSIMFGERRDRKYSTNEMEAEIENYYNACKYATKQKRKFCGKSGVLVAIISAMQEESEDSVNAFVDCANDNVIGTDLYNYKAALDFVKCYGTSFKFTSCYSDRTAIECEDAQRAIYCFIHNQKRTDKKFPIYSITKEQLAGFKFCEDDYDARSC